MIGLCSRPATDAHQAAAQRYAAVRPSANAGATSYFPRIGTYDPHSTFDCARVPLMSTAAINYGPVGDRSADRSDEAQQTSGENRDRRPPRSTSRRRKTRDLHGEARPTFHRFCLNGAAMRTCDAPADVET